MRTIEDCIKAINAAGYELNNLFQKQDWSWAANVRLNKPAKIPNERKDYLFHEFGNGETALEALLICMEKAGIE